LAALGSLDSDTDKLILFVSSKPREDVEVDESLKVWELYKNSIQGLEKLEIVPTPTPVTAVYKYAKDNPTHNIKVIFGKDDEERYASFSNKEKYPNVEIYNAGTVGNFSSTDLRQALRDNNIEKIKEFIPKEVNIDDFLAIFQTNEGLYPRYNPKKIQQTRYKASDVWTNDPDILEENNPKKGTGKKPKGSGRRLYTDEDPSDTVGVKFSSRQDIVDTLNKTSFKNKPHARQSQIINLIHQRVRAAYNKAKDPLVKARLKTALDYAEERKEVSKRKTQRLKENKYLQEARYKKYLSESWEPNKARIINQFLDYCTDYLSIDKPTIKLINSPEYTQQYHSFGGYIPSSKKLIVVVHNRNMADILRTIAHEMVHHMQNLDGRLNYKSGEEGSPDENEANSLAGVIMRKFGRENPEIFESKKPELFLNIDKFDHPKTIQQHLIENINEISLSKENAVDINGDLTGGTFKVGDITYEYNIKNIPNPYKDLGLFYNIQFTPRGEITSTPKGGKENYIKILSTMYKIIVDFLEKEKPEYVGLSSLDNNRNKNYHTVYNRLTDNPSKLIPGYFRKDANLTFNSPQGKGRFIVLKRKDSLDEVGDASVKSLPYKEVHQKHNYNRDGNVTIFNFTTPKGLEYEVEIDNYGGGLSLADVNFKVKGGRFSDETNQGEMFVIMSTVIKIVKDFLSKNDNVINVEIAASKKDTNDSRRFRIYQAYVKQHIPQGWGMDTMDAGGDIIHLIKQKTN
jgi:hypothetical protein